MYDWPEVRAATDDWAGGIMRHLGQGGATLYRNPDYFSGWRRDDLVFVFG